MSALALVATPEFRAAYEAARRRWPELDVGDLELAERVVAGGAGVRHAGDLYLAVAAGRGDARAHAAVAELVAAAAGRAVAAIAGAAAVDDIVQRVCERLLVGTDAQAKIAAYTGEVALATWLRAIAARLALDERRKLVREYPLDDTLAETLDADGVSPDLAILKDRYRARFKAAVTVALAGLAERDRSVLRFTLEHHATADEIGRIYRVHRVTVARWLRRIRDELADRIVGELGVPPGEVASMLRLIASQLSLSLDRLLA